MADFENPSTRASGYLVLHEDWNVLANNFKFFDETRYLELDIAESHPPLSDVTAAPIELVESSGAAPNPAWYQIRFDDGTVEGRQWSKPIPPEYKDSPTILFYGYMATAVAGTVVMNAYVSAQSVGDATGTTRVFDAINAATVTVPGTAGVEFAGTITLTNAHSMAARDHAVFLVARQGTATADTAGGDFCVTQAMFTYGI